MTPSPQKVDVVVVGAGPVGLFGAYYAGFRGLSVAVIDSLPEVGGQVAALYPEKQIHDVAGYVSVTGRDLVRELAAQAGQFSPLLLLGQQATTLDHQDDDSYLVGTDHGDVVHARAVVITGGIGTFTPRRLAAGSEFEGRGLQYFVPQLETMVDKDVVIVGGGDSAFDWAVSLEPLARTVALVHRRRRFRAHAATVDRVMGSRVTVLTDSEVVRVFGTTGPAVESIDGVEIQHVPSGEVRHVKAQAIVAALGFTANLGPLLEWGLQTSGRSIVVATTMETNLTRVFAAGDITDYPGKVRLIAVGFGEVATAVNNTAIVIDPSASLFPGHSTEVDDQAAMSRRSP